ncbi:MAG: HoxN/HupN/NixA family nickel/cobalt transporter [Burkholderiales bacterium]|nr:HoxN/HupN/NixA family nickel/cobalt transporter [Burkholderiales bacterium]
MRAARIGAPGRVFAAVAFLQAMALAGLALDGVRARAMMPLCLVAYTFGLRHALDADHIAAIDNTTRKLVGEGHRPAAAGLWFSLGHSAVVFLLTGLAALSLGHAGIGGQLASAGAAEGDGAAEGAGLAAGWAAAPGLGTVGTCISATYLYAVAALNWGAWRAALRSLRGASGRVCDGEAESAPSGGLMARACGRLLRRVRRSGDLFWVGLLFGLGFETATEVAVIAMSAAASARGAPAALVLTLPLCFAAGMSLLDAADGLVMLHTYTWARGLARSRALYNAVVTGLSVLVALLVGSVEWLQVLGPHVPGLTAVAEAAGRIDFGWLGGGITVMFVTLFIWMWRVRRRDGRSVGAAGADARGLPM